MPLRIIRSGEQIEMLAAQLAEQKFPITVSWSAGAPRTDAQNRLAHRWYRDLAFQFQDRRPTTVKAECKLDFAAKILGMVDLVWYEAFQEVFDGMSREKQVRVMEITEFPVTSLMKLKQMTEYMDIMWEYWRGQGYSLTDPAAMKYQEEFGQ